MRLFLKLSAHTQFIRGEISQRLIIQMHPSFQISAKFSIRTIYESTCIFTPPSDRLNHNREHSAPHGPSPYQRLCQGRQYSSSGPPSHLPADSHEDDPPPGTSYETAFVTEDLLLKEGNVIIESSFVDEAKFRNDETAEYSSDNAEVDPFSLIE